MATLNSGDLAAARTLLLAYLANSDNDSIGNGRQIIDFNSYAFGIRINASNSNSYMPSLRNEFSKIFEDLFTLTSFPFGNL